MRRDNYRLPAFPAGEDMPTICHPFIRWALGGSQSPQQWPADADPDQVRGGLEAHAIAPLLYHRLKVTGGLDETPDWLATYLRNASIQSLALHMCWQQQIVPILKRLVENGVDVLLLKGAALAWSVYPSPAVRPMIDLDVLVRPEQIPLAVALLQNAGLHELPQPTWPEFAYHRKLAGIPPTGLLIELHWRLSQRVGLADCLPVEDLFSRSEAGPGPFANVRTLSRLDHLLHAALHLAAHQGVPQLRRLADVDALCRGLSNEEWTVLADRAYQSDLSLVLAATLQSASELFGTAVPTEFWDRMTAAGPPTPTALISFDYCRPRGAAATELLELRLLPNWRCRLRFAMSHAFPNRAYLRWRYGPGLAGRAPWGYLLRWTNGIAALLRHGAGDRAG